MYRHGSYDEKLSKKLKNQKFAKIFLLTLMEGDEGLSLLEALKHSIKRMGIKEFSGISKIPEKSISRMLGSKKLPKIETLNKYCTPFGLKVYLDLEDVA
ncbi:MAG: hypothetical protein OXB84_02510 [Halobacteriovoraceae bacterium]|nr:hypothetical protein [Halobacteriovoraceae bacterium]